MIDKNPGVPNIGAKSNKELIDEAMKCFIEELNPIIGRMGTAIEDLQREVEILDRVQKIFPDKVTVDVTVKHEYPKNLVFESVKIISKKEEKK